MRTAKTLPIVFLALALGLSAPAFAQTVTPNTTLCAAVALTDTQVCLASTTGVKNQTGLYIDQEYMTVLLSANQTIGTTNAYVPVTRGNRAAGSGPTIHNNSRVVWVSETPADTVVPGSNGFNLSTTQNDVGPCTRGLQTYLPHIYPNLGQMRDCNSSGGTAAGYWVDFNPMGGNQKPAGTPIVLLTTNGALAVTSGNYVITKAGVLADTLAAPTAGTQDGTLIVLTSSTANAHTLTATGLLQTGSANVNVATFAASAGASLTLMAYNGKWIVLSSNQITFS